jgi:hypothetical protein
MSNNNPIIEDGGSWSIRLDGTVSCACPPERALRRLVEDYGTGKILEFAAVGIALERRRMWEENQKKR